jgi:hypothetical protein
VQIRVTAWLPGRTESGVSRGAARLFFFVERLAARPAFASASASGRIGIENTGCMAVAPRVDTTALVNPRAIASGRREAYGITIKEHK